MEKELVKKVVKITNFTVTEIQKLIDIYKEATQVFNATNLSDNHSKLEQEWDWYAWAAVNYWKLKFSPNRRWQSPTENGLTSLIKSNLEEVFRSTGKRRWTEKTFAIFSTTNSALLMTSSWIGSLSIPHFKKRESAILGCKIVSPGSTTFSTRLLLMTSTSRSGCWDSVSSSKAGDHVKRLPCYLLGLTSSK